MKDPNEKIIVGVTRYELLINAMKRIANSDNEWSDVDPDDGLAGRLSIRSFAKDALKIIGEEDV